MKKIGLSVVIVVMICATVCMSVQAANTTNKAWSVEYFDGWWYYDGNIQFTPSYVIPKDAGYDLEEGKQVKQAYINYTRKKYLGFGKEVSIIGGRQYTREATSRSTTAKYSVSATAKDSINILTNKTKFYYDWIYFD